MIANRWNIYELLMSSSIARVIFALRNVNRPDKMAGFFSSAVLSDYDSADLEENGSHTEVSLYGNAVYGARWEINQFC